jgi:nucleotide-binding universal stress UspA family protein
MPLNAPIADSSTQPSTLVCVSNEAESAVALRFGCLRAKRRNHHITILHVLEPTEFQGLSSITDAIREEREEQADNLLLEMERQASEQGIEHPSLMIRVDTLWNGIVAAIEENPNINMVILAVRPDSHRGPKLMAALTEELGNSIRVPIMVVPGDLTEEQVNLLS